MAVTDGLWWSMWWPWMTAWLVTAAGAVALAVVLIRHAHERRRRTRRGQSAYSICLFLDEKAVIDLWLIGNYSAALEQAVEHRTNVNTTVSFWARLLSWIFRIKRDVTQETFRSYVEKNEPISVIGMLMGAFEQADVIVHADLPTLAVTPTRALATALGPQPDVTLSDIEELVSIRGRFTTVPGTSEGFVLRASYGDLEPPAYVRVVGASEWLRRTIPTGTFTARCLGKTTGWRDDTREVTLEALAIFW